MHKGELVKRTFGHKKTENNRKENTRKKNVVETTLSGNGSSDHSTTSKCCPRYKLELVRVNRKQHGKWFCTMANVTRTWRRQALWQQNALWLSVSCFVTMVIVTTIPSSTTYTQTLREWRTMVCKLSMNGQLSWMMLGCCVHSCHGANSPQDSAQAFKTRRQAGSTPVWRSEHRPSNPQFQWTKRLNNLHLSQGMLVIIVKCSIQLL